MIDRALNRDSGLKGLTGHNDMREVLALREQGDEAARLGFDVYCYRLRKYVGGYYAALGTVDAVVFTGGVGLHTPAGQGGDAGRPGAARDRGRRRTQPRRTHRRADGGLHRRQ